MIKGVYKFADCAVEIISIYKEIHLISKKYSCDVAPEFSISVSDEDIIYERSLATVDSTDGYLETLAVIRKLSELLIENGVLLFHGSALCLDGVGYIFSAKSGTGKSTHTALWKQVFGDKVTIINDDKPFIKVCGNSAYVYGSPWDGKHHLSSNTNAPLKKICFINRSNENYITKRSPVDVYHRIFQQTYKPKDKELLEKTVQLISNLCNLVDFYELGCNTDPEAAILAFNGMK